MNNLKPCPFCGREDEVFFNHAINDGFGYFTPASIGCKRCGFKKGGFFISVNNDAELSEQMSNQMLIDWWNKRA